MKKKTMIIVGTIIGIGAAAATVFAVKNGPAMKKELQKRTEEIQAKLKSIEMSDVKQAVATKLEEVKESIDNFDWEACKQSAEKKFYEIKKSLKIIKEHSELAEIDHSSDS